MEACAIQQSVLNIDDEFLSGILPYFSCCNIGLDL